jgi:ATP-binding cassette, subfamily B, bacterial HlyB/CyaB
MTIDLYSGLLKDYSLLGMIFDETELNAFISNLQSISHKDGEIIFTEGAPSDFLYIPLSGDVELFSEFNGEIVTNGHVQPGRTINTYAFLRNSTYQYSCRFSKSGELLKIPGHLIREVMKSKPTLEKYLLSMTESHEVRGIAKELTSQGCSQKFRINFIASLETKNFEPQTWVLSPGEVPGEALYVTEGQLTSQSQRASGSGVVQIQVPNRSWLGWKNLIEKAACRNVFKSISPTRAFVISEAAVEKLQELFPDDFEIFSSSVLSGVQGKDESDELAEDFDLEEIYQNRSNKRMFWESWPWVQQNDQMDCGPACLAMISEFYKKKIPIQYWRGQLSTNKEGTSLFDLALTCEQNGFTAAALEVEDISTLDRNFFPAIALRQYHYIVIYEVNKNSVTVGDPGVGIRKMSLDDFNTGYEQSILFLHPNESFFALTVPSGKYVHYLSLLRGLGREIFLTTLISVMLVILGLLNPILGQIFMDDVLVNRDMDLLKLIIAAGLGVTMLNGFLGWARAYYSNYLTTKFDYKSKSLFVKKMLSLHYRFFAERHVGDFTRRLDEMEKLRSFLLYTLEELIVSLLSLAVYSAALIFYAPIVAGTFFVAIPVFFLISWLSSKKLSAIYQTIFTESAEIESNLNDTIKAISTVKSLSGEMSSRWKYEEKLVVLLQAVRKFSLTDSTIGVIGGFYTSLVNYAIMGLAAYLAIRGELTPGQVIATTMISGNILGPLMRIADKIGELEEIKAVMGRLNDVFLSPSETVNHKGKLKKDFLRGEIEFRDVWFRYGGEGSDWTLKGVSFRIEAGQNVAFVGPSGSGKSTVAALIARLFEPTKGQIFIDGRDYLDYDITWLRTQLGILQQESHLFFGSIAENISFNDPKIDMARVQSCAEKAAAEKFISAKPGGFGYMISAGGLGLSGGEKQRISMARLFYRNPSILILDEATSALDGISERELLRNLKSDSVKTIISIAHRYSTVKFSDYVLVLFDGKVVGFGTQPELLQDNNIFRQLFGSDSGLNEEELDEEELDEEAGNEEQDEVPEFTPESEEVA